MAPKRTPANEAYRRAREGIEQAREGLLELRDHKLDELRRIEGKLAAVHLLFGGKSKA
jgi:hypothetical protein